MVVLTVTLPPGRDIPLTDALDLGEAQQILSAVRDLFEDSAAIAEGWRVTDEPEAFRVSRGSFSALFALVAVGRAKKRGRVPDSPAVELTGRVATPRSAASGPRRTPPGD
jgi:hypothetical protein